MTFDLLKFRCITPDIFCGTYFRTVGYLLLLLLLALQPTVGFSFLSDFLPLCPFVTLLSPPSFPPLVICYSKLKTVGGAYC